MYLNVVPKETCMRVSYPLGVGAVVAVWGLLLAAPAPAETSKRALKTPSTHRASSGSTKSKSKPAPLDESQIEARSAAEKKVATIGAASDLQALLERVSKLSFPEQNKGVKLNLKMMAKAAAQIQKKIQAAHADRDIVKINCLNDKYLQIRAADKLTRKFHKKMLEAQKAADHSTRNHEFAKIAILAEKVRVKIEESKTCDGKSSELLGQTEVSTEKAEDAEGAKDPSKATDVPGDPDPYTSMEITPAGPLFRPPLASPSA